jgi:predicted short-subunit dehydrogenase-like oxidoreductase (DUF2520 family)
MIERVAIIGFGKVGRYLKNAFALKGLEVTVFERSPQKPAHHHISNFSGDFDFCVLCVPDRVIRELSSQIAPCSGILSHSSGTVSLDALDEKHHNRGIFYPLMSIHANTTLDLSEIPICIEASNQESRFQIEKFAQKLKVSFFPIDSETRKHLHLAAVIAHNFSNYLYHWAFKELQTANLPLEILKPLLQQQVNGLGNQDPIHKQTGPAVRGDENTQKAHLEMLENPQLAALYKEMTALIKNDYEEEL